MELMALASSSRGVVGGVGESVNWSVDLGLAEDI
jgi:hypothetical protein